MNKQQRLNHIRKGRNALKQQTQGAAPMLAKAKPVKIVSRGEVARPLLGRKVDYDKISFLF